MIGLVSCLLGFESLHESLLNEHPDLYWLLLLPYRSCDVSIVVHILSVELNHTSRRELSMTFTILH